nr:histidine kinase [Verrucomicrobiaceae bacterium]
MPRLTIRHFHCLAAWLCLAATHDMAAQEINTALGVRSLRAEEAKEGRSVVLRGTVILIEAPGTVFVQDATAGTFFRTKQPVSDLAEGDVVEVKGKTFPGLYLSGIELDSYQILSHGAPVAARPVSYDELASGHYHYQRVEVEGVVRSIAATDETRATIRLALGSRVLEVRVDRPPVGFESLVDATVKVQGLAAGTINDMRQLVQPYLRVSSWQELAEVQPAPAIDALPMVPASSLLRFDPKGESGHRVRMKGVVTAVFNDGLAFIRDAEAAVAVRPSSPLAVVPGDTITVYGFPVMAQFTPTLEDAGLLEAVPGLAPAPMHLPIGELFKRGHEGELVSISGVVIGNGRSDGERSVLGGDAHEVEIHAVNGDKLGLAPSAVVEVTGICRVETASGKGFNSKPRTLSLWLRSAADVQVLKAPSWWTVERLLSALGLLAAAMLAAAIWILLLRKRVKQQTEALRDRIKHEAALEERQRIAREFHDTLEQELAGLSIRMDAAITRPLDDKARSLLEASRSLVSRIQVEARNLVADLRDDSASVQDLAVALQELTQRQSPSGPLVDLHVEGTSPRLPPHVAHHLRMIVQEAVTNALKHAQARHITVRMRTTDEALHLSVGDDGRGFNPSDDAQGKPGHFGCMGIRERSQKIGASVCWQSRPGQGTTLEVVRPLPHSATP